jgi:alkylhydroperoxidase family enzyme
MAWIRTVPIEEAEGPLRAHYDAALRRAGRVYGVVRLMSLEPHVLAASMGLYQATTTDARSPLPRFFRELIAVIVSRANHCFY